MKDAAPHPGQDCRNTQLSEIGEVILKLSLNVMRGPLSPT
ncbi:hypothetical protein OCAR_6633 [Afipia carboxidovorans OM5]|nr:hypothetical protein OCAR_6633 [Afipia carboxidovorans OM5]